MQANLLMSKKGFKTKVELDVVPSGDNPDFPLANGDVVLQVDRCALTANVV